MTFTCKSRDNLVPFVEQGGTEPREDTQFRLVDRVDSTRWGQCAA
jgi:hypothetical protein